MKKRFSLLINLLILTLFFCTSTIAQNATLTVQQDERIEGLLALKKSLEKDNKLTDGYTIQLYYGSMNQATGVLNNYKTKFTEWPAAIEYETPNYKVWVGNYPTRMEADRALMAIQTEFPSAFILKPGRNKKE